MTKTRYAEKNKIDRLRKLYERSVIKGDGCWDWKNRLLAKYNKEPKQRNGIARYPSTGRDNVRINRVSWIIHKGPIPDGMFVLHKCDNPRCTNPDHLFLGTSLNNFEDMRKKGRRYMVQGDSHPFSKLNADKVMKIKELLVEGLLSLTKIGKLFDVSRACIRNIRDGKTWKHVSS